MRTVIVLKVYIGMRMSNAFQHMIDVLQDIIVMKMMKAENVFQTMFLVNPAIY
jgi:hypothetical protein